ncbi:hypothetical protein CYLTODRAFT_455817 [Cylindrobasidium torrendii FP15055 ss-10]|uniref:DRBM domain-containing protein n=1 Tax=Cylindrobasidium torrendii FP15055 ss-10 TaxID=1314674 RepID=A0A0D7B650_9AGAR|nr:hypothetical protein CYLTODRAFT_455817 [Cylindrobasidium torrendii FP15055 ss-10]
MTMPKFVTLLNNHYQALGDTSVISYPESVTGPSDKARWTVVFSGRVLGTGVGPSKAAAKEESAKAALKLLGLIS